MNLSDVDNVEDLENYLENLAVELIQTSETEEEALQQATNHRFGQPKDLKTLYDTLEKYDGEEIREAEKQAMEPNIDTRIAEVNAETLRNLLKREIQAQIEKENTPIEVKT